MTKLPGRFILAAVAIAIHLPVSPAAAAPAAGRVPGEAAGSPEWVARLEREIPALMEDHAVPGLSIAVIHDGSLVWAGEFGVADAGTRRPVTEATVFEGASTGKTVFAYAVMRLVERGEMDLDTPLIRYAPISYLKSIWSGYDAGGDPRMRQVTARRVLSHSAGFPNWPGDVQEFLFDPGEGWGYSGSGYVLLGEVVRRVTGLSLDAFVAREVFQPLGMGHSAFAWHEGLQGMLAMRHSSTGRPLEPHRYIEPMAAGSLYTNARDYARFLLALLNGTGLSEKLAKEMMSPQVQVTQDATGELHWGLGLGLVRRKRGLSFWHHGDNGDCKAYFEVFLPSRSGLVYFANGRNGLAMAPALLETALGRRDAGLLKKPFSYATGDTP